MAMSNLIIVPARYNSTRFPGKPLALLDGISMIVRTARNAEAAAKLVTCTQAIVATDNDQIKKHCEENGIICVMTPPDLPSGSDRALLAAKIYAEQTGEESEFIVNLQGDAPFTPPDHILACLKTLQDDESLDLTTPYVSLSWEALDQLRLNKKATPFSGTTVVSNKQGLAIWFSKNIIPAIRNEHILRDKSSLSPVCRHIGLYAYRKKALEKFVRLPVGYWEELEGLEQLRCLENNMRIGCVAVNPAEVAISGIDTPEDLARAEKILRNLIKS